MSGQQNNIDRDREIMLGDLPLLNSSHFTAQGEDWVCSSRLENFQRILHRESQKGDGAIDMNSLFHDRIPYHPDILPRWEAFCKETIQKESTDDDNQIKPRKRREGLRSALEEKEVEEVVDEEDDISRTNLSSFRIKNIVLPPSPFFKKKLLPLLKTNANLLSLELRDCNLGANSIACVAKFLKKNKSLATLDISSNKIKNADAAKALGFRIKKRKSTKMKSKKMKKSRILSKYII